MKTKLSTKAQLWIFGAIGLLFMLLLALGINWIRIGTLSSQAKQRQANIDALTQTAETNNQIIEVLSSPSYADQKAYEELGLKENEKDVYTGKPG